MDATTPEKNTDIVNGGTHDYKVIYRKKPGLMRKVLEKMNVAPRKDKLVSIENEDKSFRGTASKRKSEKYYRISLMCKLLTKDNEKLPWINPEVFVGQYVDVSDLIVFRVRPALITELDGKPALYYNVLANIKLAGLQAVVATMAQTLDNLQALNEKK